MLIKIDREGLRKALLPQQVQSDLRRAASLIIPILERGLLFAKQGSYSSPIGNLATKCEGAGYFLPVKASWTGRPLFLVVIWADLSFLGFFLTCINLRFIAPRIGIVIYHNYYLSLLDLPRLERGIFLSGSPREVITNAPERIASIIASSFFS